MFKVGDYAKTSDGFMGQVVSSKNSGNGWQSCNIELKNHVITRHSFSMTKMTEEEIFQLKLEQ